MYKIFATLLFFSSFVGIGHPQRNSDASPQLPLEIYDEAFAKILGEEPKLKLIATGFGFTEGPVYLNEGVSEKGYLFFTDQIHDNINLIRWYGMTPFNEITDLSYSRPTVFRHPSNIADGQTQDLQGRLITCETTGRRVSITDFDGSVKTLAGLYEGKPFNSPNDVIVKSDGTVWFTDPSYGCLQFPQQCYLPNGVYCFDPKTNEVTLVAKEFEMPNGLAFSPDESILYVIDSAAIQAPMTYYEKKPHAIYKLDVLEGNKLGEKKHLVTVSPGFPDGMRLDSFGNIYSGAYDGIQVYNPQGVLIGKIKLPKQTANLTFGGKDNNVLFICSSDSVWAIRLNTTGAVPVRQYRGSN